MLFVGCSVLVTVYFVVWCCSCGFWLVLVLGLRCLVCCWDFCLVCTVYCFVFWVCVKSVLVWRTGCFVLWFGPVWWVWVWVVFLLGCCVLFDVGLFVDTLFGVLVCVLVAVYLRFAFGLRLRLGHVLVAIVYLVG